MKFIRYSISFILLSLFLVVAIVSVKLDAILHNAVNTYGSKLLGTDVRIKKITVDVMKGNLEVRDLSIKNPYGFSAQDAVYIPTIVIHIKPKNLLHKPILIDKISIDSPIVNFELNNQSNNISALKNRIQKTTTSNKEKKEDISTTDKAKTESPIAVEYLVINNIKLNADLDVLEQTLDIGKIELKGINNAGYIPYEQLIKQALEQIVQKAISEAKFDLKINGTKINVFQGTKEVVKDANKELTSYLKNTIKKILPH